MDTSEQNKIVQDVILSMTKKNNALDKRLAYQEAAEYALLHFYGSMYQYNAGTTIVVSAASTFYPVTGMSVGLLNGWTFSDPSLTCVQPGVYVVNYGLNSTGVTDNNIHTAVQHNGTDLPATHSDILTTSAGGHISMAGLGLVRVVAGDTIRLAVANFTDADDIPIDSASVVIKRIGD